MLFKQNNLEHRTEQNRTEQNRTEQNRTQRSRKDCSQEPCVTRVRVRQNAVSAQSYDALAGCVGIFVVSSVPGACFVQSGIQR